MANPYLSVIVININGSNYLIKGQRVAELSRNQSSNPHKTLCWKGHILIENEKKENGISLKWKVTENRSSYFYVQQNRL